MPFVQRIIEPKFLSRTSLHNDDGEPLVSDYELEAVTNNTLSNALRQLASLVLVANDIFTELTKELQKVSARTSTLKIKIGAVEKKVEEYDPKQVAVPEGDLSTFALQTKHHASSKELETGLFTAETRPEALRLLYEQAAKTPVHVMRQMDRWRRDGHRSSRFFLCTPVLGAKRKKLRTKFDYDIETRMPASVEELRRWTSTEALGDVTVTTDCMNRIGPNSTVTEADVLDTGATSADEDGIDHKLPSPEEQLQVIALKFPAEIVAVDVSGRRFDRMSMQRRSLLRPEVTYTTEEDTENNTIRRRARTRKPRGKRRNTLAGTDQKEIVDALTSRDEPSSSITGDQESPENTPVIRSKSSDLLRSSKKASPENKKSHFNSLKQWGKNKLKIMNKSHEKSEPDHTRAEDVDDINIYETVSNRKWKHDKILKGSHERKTSYSSSEKSSSISLPISTPVPPVLNTVVKLRDSSVQMRQRRNGTGKDEQHSSSGNWSASSESGRASIGSEITSTTTHPKSTTSAATSSNSLNQHNPPSSVNSRRRFINTSASSSVTSEGTLTPDIIHDAQDDGETSSVYSCDTEGYYTSFHMDSGLKTLKEEESSLPATPLHSTTAFSSSSNNCTILTAENEYELFGKGSTSTTTSSAGTVCTTLMAADSNKSLSIGPVVPERKSSLACNNSRSPSSSLERDFGSDKTGTVKRSPADHHKETVTALVHNHDTDNGDVSPDSGHNTSSSPIESVSSPNGAPSGSEFEFSESSDLEGVDRIERIRIKTTINSSRIPSMCVITPPHSDDESVVSDYSKKEKKSNGIPDLGSKNLNRTKLNLLLQPTETDLDTIEFTQDNKDKEIISNKSTESDNNKYEPNGNKLHNLDNKNVKNCNGKRVVTPQPEYMTPTSIKPVQNVIKSSPPQTVFKATLLPLNSMFGKLKTNISNFARKEKSPIKPQLDIDDGLFDSGDYVTIADVRNNNEKSAKLTAEVHYANDVVKPVAQTNTRIRETEYVSLQELPTPNDDSESKSLERKRHGARVTLDAEGKVVYTSDSLRRRKGGHSTFEPGPCVKDPATQSPLPVHRTPKVIRPVNQDGKSVVSVAPVSTSSQAPVDSRPLSPQMNKVVIRANPKTSSGVVTPTADCVRMLPATIVTPSIRPMSPKLTSVRGAYVNMQEDRDRSLSPAIEEERGSYASYNHHPPGREIYEQDNRMDQNIFMQRGTAMYSTLPSRKPPKVYQEERETYRRYSPQTVNYQGQISDNYGYQSLPRRPIYSGENMTFNRNVQANNISPKVSNIFQNQVPLNVQNIRNQQYNFHSSTPNKDPANIPKIPMGISNFFSPIKKPIDNAINESIKVSPIEPCNSGKFQSSTPHKPVNSAINLSNKLLSPKKSTMSNEELYAAIHRSKKKLNIKTDYTTSNSPTPSLTESLTKIELKQPESGYLAKPQTRSSWSPNNDEISKNLDALDTKPGSRQSWACNDRLGTKKTTSRLDFKKLLLQQSTKTPALQATKKLSAVEQLRLSKDHPKKVQSPLQIADLSASPKNLGKKFMNGPSDIQNTSPEKRPPTKIMSPRSTWRFANPRSDVLSSTILEDCREDETSHSSNELINSPRNKEVIQNSVANCNTVSDASRKMIPNKFNENSFKINKPGNIQQTRAQYLQARKDAYFNNHPSSNIMKNNVRDSPPTLETAL